MNYMDFDPYLIRQHNEQIFEEVHSRRLAEQLRENRKPGEARRSWPQRLAAALSRLGRPSTADASRR